jgi:two-component system LytT family sensor kinase
MNRNRVATGMIHVLGWLLLIALLVAFVSVTPEGQPPAGGRSVFPFSLFMSVYLGLFYINQALVSRLYLRRRYVLYGLVFALLFLAVCIGRPFENLIIHGGGPGNGHRNVRLPRAGHQGPLLDIISMILFVMVWAISTLLTILRQWREAQQLARQADKAKLSAELSYLKAQVNPLFLFNTLNNIYALTVLKSDEAPQAVLKLSNIMRYMTDEAMNERVPLSAELACLGDYIDLQRMRLNEKAEVSFVVEGDVDGIEIAPMLLMTFVENVFKHGISSHEATHGEVHVAVAQGELRLSCRNRVFPSSGAERPGTGIENVRQRLQLVYPQRHELTIARENGYYAVHLKLQIT